MDRRAVASLLFAALWLSGCSWFATKKQPLPGERISVLNLDRQTAPDPALTNTAITLPRAEVNPDWPGPGGNPNHAMGHPALPAKLTEAWKVSVGEGSSRYTRVLAPPIVAKGRIYALDGGVQVSAYDAATGNRFWQIDATPAGDRGTAFGGGLAFWQDRLFVSTGYGQVLKLDPTTGKRLWSKNVGVPVHGGPTVTEGRIFVITVENELVALSADDGRKLWTHNGIPEPASLLGGASPAVDGEIVVVPYSSGELYALAIENGRPLWSDNLAAARTVDAVSALADIRGRPVVDRGRVFAAGHSGRTAAIDLRSGERVWEQEIGSTYGPWVVGDYVYLLSNDNELVCLTRDEGKVRWVHQLPSYQNEKDKEGPIRWAGPVLGGDRLILLSSDGSAMFISPYTGKPLGHQDLPAGVNIPPVIAGNSLYVLTDTAELIAYR